MKELETRILDIDIDAIRKKVIAMGAIKVKEENQINSIYDFNDRRLLNSKGYARIRTVEDLLNRETKYYLTTKKLISQEVYKIMDENEITINDPVEAKGILEALGLELVQTIKKYRESYKYKNTLVEVDINDKAFCPFPYLEIETNDEDELKEVVKLLGYTLEDTTSKTIFEILGERGLLSGV